ncbi:hypothetical protein CAEBREN_05209 [Caenorhabditis brenneri]|uniref:Uncharacterized protein n=1 Tax=Caenorhabditis brenneri TaxID=135651 RepID=G0P0N5_CAEBE|nr:hypothetical protein CAEBREN_05209 [Caenorhabditis brenneri]
MCRLKRCCSRRSELKEGKVLAEFKENWSEEVENGRVIRIEVPLKENAPKLMVIIDTDDDDNYLYRLYVDNKPLEEYMADYMRWYGIWEIEKLGAKSKFVYETTDYDWREKRVPRTQRVCVSCGAQNRTRDLDIRAACEQYME